MTVSSRGALRTGAWEGTVRRASTLILAFLLGTAGTATAQTSSGGSIRGYVTDEQKGVLAGVTLTATSLDVAGTYTTVSDAEGYYRLLDLQPGEYTLTAELQGFSKFVRPGIAVRAGLNLSVYLVMKVGAMTETVDVKADTPMLESKTATQAVNISGELQRALPLTARRDWSGFLLVAPGVMSFQTSTLSYYVHGTPPVSHVFQIDGVDVTSVLQNSNQHTSLNTDAISDVQVKTSAVDASAPLGLGAVVSIAAVSGTNDLKGSATFVYQPKRWNDNNEVGGRALTQTVRELDISLGGPILRDRWWFFAAYRLMRNRLGVSRNADQVVLLRSLVPSFEPVDNKNDGDLFFVKTTGQLSPKHRVQLSWARDVFSLGGAATNDAGYFLDSKLGGPNYSARLSSVWGSSLTTRVLVAYNEKGQENRLYGREQPGRAVHQRAFLSAGRLVGTGVIAVLDSKTFPGLVLPESKWTVSADATLQRANLLGSHELQAGVFLQPRLHDEWVTKYNSNGFQLEEVVLRDPNNPAAGFTPFHRQVFDVAEVTTRLVDSSDAAVYLQDAWRPTSRLTLNAGLRVDLVKRTDRLFSEVIQDSTEIGPRFGLNYQVTRDGRNTVRASWSRVHQNLSVNQTTAGTNVAGFRDLYDLDLDGVFETAFATPPRTAVLSDRLFDLAGYHQPYADEWTFGYRRQLPGQVSLDAGVTRRQYHDRPALVDTNGIYDGGVFRGYRNEALNEIFRLTSNVWNWPTYTGLELRLTKQTSRVQVLGSYTRQWRHIEGTWQPNDPASFIQPEAFPNNRGIGAIGGALSGASTGVNSLSGTDMTDNAPWHDNAGSLGFTWSGPWGLELGAHYLFQSGAWSGPIVTRLPAADPRFGPPTVRLANGRVVANPLATTIRFAFATRGEGQFKTTDLHQVNLRLGRALHIGGARVNTAIDALNITNHDAYQLVRGGGNQTYSPFYGGGISRQLPRSVGLSVRVSF